MRTTVLALLWSALAGCHQSMTQQARYGAQAPAAIFADGAAAQAPPAHTVAQDDLAREADAAQPPPATPELLARGRERFGIFCTPCHGLAGDGDGMVVQRGFPAPPSYHQSRLRQAPAQHFFDVITHGYGLMYAYGDRVPPRDRWAIVAYLRALQLTRMDASEAAPAPETSP